MSLPCSSSDSDSDSEHEKNVKRGETWTMVPCSSSWMKTPLSLRSLRRSFGGRGLLPLPLSVLMQVLVKGVGAEALKAESLPVVSLLPLNWRLVNMRASSSSSSSSY